MVNSVITYTLLISIQPLNPPYQRDREEFGKFVDGTPTNKCLHISKIYHSFLPRLTGGQTEKGWGYNLSHKRCSGLDQTDAEIRSYKRTSILSPLQEVG
jgi:hypothetical protein